MQEIGKGQGICSISGSQAELIRLRRKLRQKTDYLANLSHDVRIPLCGVTGYIDLALQSNDPEIIHEYLYKAQASGRIMMKLINDTLDYDRIEASAFQLRQESVSASEMFHQVITSVLPSMEAKHIDFRADLPKSDDIWIYADTVRVQEIFMNLLSNAVKFTPEGGRVSFRVSSAFPDAAHIQYQVCIKDSGCGISEKFLPQVYEPYSQERTEAAASAGGSGLGLAIVQRLVELMDGKILIESRIGLGTSVAVTLNFKKSAAVKTAGLSAGNTGTRELEGLNILLCEDNEMNMEIIKYYLEGSGAAVSCAAGGKSAVELFSQSQPGHYQIILMDIRMPLLDGCAAARRIRKLPRQDAAKVAIIAMTADVYAEDVKRCLEAGMNGHIPKPVERSRLIREILRNRK